MGSFASGRTAIPTPRSTAQGFADRLNSLLNQTISESRLSLIQLPHDPNVFELTRLVKGTSEPLGLRGSSARLFVRQVVQVIGGRCRMESYVYRLQNAEARDSWLIRWEYERDPPRSDYPYARAHVHVNGTFPHGSSIDPLHIPTRCIPLESIASHLIVEWEVASSRQDWQNILADSVEGFDARPSVH